MNELRIGTAVSSGTGKAKGFLRVGDLPDGSPVEIPVMIARGASDGPTLWVNGCVHGDEYCGAFIIHEWFRSLDTQDLRGTTIALPVLNMTGFLKNQRTSPFETMAHGDLNRCFPGKPDGSLTEQMAHAIYTPLREHADYFIDMHTALTADVRWALFANAPGDVGRKGEGMARAFGYKSTLPAPMDILAGSSMITAAQDGIPAYIVETAGRGPAFTEEAVLDAAERLRNVCRHLEMLPGKVTDYGPLTFFSNFAWVNATRGGLFQPAVKCHDRLEQGGVVGRYYDLYGELIEEVHSPAAGIVLAINPGPLMANGEILVHIGLEPRKA